VVMSYEAISYGRQLSANGWWGARSCRAPDSVRGSRRACPSLTVAVRTWAIPGGRAFLRFLQERHHGAKLAADFFDGLMLGFSRIRRSSAAGFVLVDPFLGELARLDLLKDALHLFARLLVDDAGPRL